MVTRIGPRHPSQLYLRQWREKSGLTQQQLADRIAEIAGTNTAKGTISRWENNKPGTKDHRSPSDDALGALAEALNIGKADLFRSPDRPSVDALLRDLPQEKQRAILEVVQVMIKQAS